VYRPILHDKLAEMHALASLSPALRAAMHPVLQVRHPTKSDKASNSWSPSTALLNVVQDPNSGILGCWGTEFPISVDLRLIRPREFDHLPVADMFEHCGELGIKAVPVTGRGLDQDFRRSTAQAARRLGNGVCIRLVDEELGVGTSAIRGLLSELDVPRETIDLVFDLGNLPSGSTFLLGGLVRSYVRRFSPVTDWRSISIACTSFPENLAECVGHNSFNLLPRTEQNLWKIVSQELSNPLQPDFADYGIVSANPPPGFRGAANLRYATHESWYVLRGGDPDAAGSADYLNLAAILRESDLWRGEHHCPGCRFVDSQIDTQRLGNPKQWREAGFAHHFAVIGESVLDL
jgi:hypothetical protein